tara:strand:+ start:3102 stop:3206 length:105 start_codon:yes stop_codon:yes gene_type:complete
MYHLMKTVETEILGELLFNPKMLRNLANKVTLRT